MLVRIANICLINPPTSGSYSAINNYFILTKKEMKYKYTRLFTIATNEHSECVSLFLFISYLSNISIISNCIHNLIILYTTILSIATHVYQLLLLNIHNYSYIYATNKLVVSQCKHCLCFSDISYFAHISV